jgi:hypothetical protein
MPNLGVFPNVGSSYELEEIGEMSRNDNKTVFAAGGACVMKQIVPVSLEYSYT